MLERLEQQQKLTTNQWKIVATANLGDLLDFFDFYLVGYALSFIVKEWQLTYGESAKDWVGYGLAQAWPEDPGFHAALVVFAKAHAPEVYAKWLNEGSGS